MFRKNRRSPVPAPPGMPEMRRYAPMTLPGPELARAPSATMGSVRAVKIGLFAVDYGTCADPEVAVRVVQHAEAGGFESVWTGEHVVLPDPAPRGFTIPPTLPFLDTDSSQHR